MIYLMFHNPMTAGLVVFFGGMSSMFRKVVRRQRKLTNVPFKAFEKIFDRKQRKLRSVFDTEKK